MISLTSSIKAFLSVSDPPFAFLKIYFSTQNKKTDLTSALSVSSFGAITLFDIYQEPLIPEEKKGISYRIRYQANDRTTLSLRSQIKG